MTLKSEKDRKKTANGYYRLAKSKNRKAKFQHHIVWEKHFGPIPDGMQIHHIDHNKINNDISNLQLVTPLEHKRIHSGCRLIDGEWEKPCNDCGEYKKCNSENWYFSRGWINGKLCKKCFIKKSLATREELIKKGWKRKQYNKNR